MFTLKRTPDSEQLLQRKIGMAKLFIQNRDYKTAKQHIDEALAIKPNSSAAYKLLSQINEAIGDNEQASINYNKFLELKNSLIDPNLSLEGNVFSPSKFSSPDASKIIKSHRDTPLVSNGCDDKLIIQSIENTLNGKLPIFNESLGKIVETLTKNTQEISILKKKVIGLSSKHEEIIQKLNALESGSNQNFIKQEKSVDGICKELHKLSLDNLNFMKEFENLNEVIKSNAFRKDYDEDESYDEDEHSYDRDNAAYSNQARQSLQDNLPKLNLCLTKKGGWECSTCSTYNGDEEFICPACETPKDGIDSTSSMQAQEPAPAFKFGSFANSSGFSFGGSKSITQTTQPASKPFELSPSTNSANGIFGSINTNGNNSSLFGSNTTAIFGSKTPSLYPNASQSPGLIFGNAGATNTLDTSGGSVFANLAKPVVTNSAPNAPVSSIIPSPFSFKDALNNLPQSNNFTFNLNTRSSKQNILPSSDDATSAVSSVASASLFNTSNTFSFGPTSIQTNSGPQSNFRSSLSAEKTKEKGDEPCNVDLMNSPEKDGPEHFKLPNVKLPDDYEQVTGEEEEDVLFDKKAKLYIFCDGEYKERGVGMFKILKHQKTSKVRILMRREVILKVCLNITLSKTFPIEVEKKNEKLLTFKCVDFSEEAPKPGVFLLRFANIDIMNEFLNLINDLMEESDDAKLIDSPFSFSSEKNIDDVELEIVYEKKPKPEHIEIIEKLQLPVNFYDYEDKPECKGCIGCREDLDWNSLTKSNELSSNASDNGGLGLFSELASDIRETVEKVDTISSPNKAFETDEQSFVSEKSKLLPTNFQVKTGEEEEETFFTENAKLFRFVETEWKERGRGVMKILKRKDKDEYRLLMRRDVLFNVICNQNINLVVGLKTHDTPKTLFWAGIDFSDNEKGETFNFIIRFRDETIANTFKDFIISHQKVTD